MFVGWKEEKAIDKEKDKRGHKEQNGLTEYYKCQDKPSDIEEQKIQAKVADLFVH